MLCLFFGIFVCLLAWLAFLTVLLALCVKTLAVRLGSRPVEGVALAVPSLSWGGQARTPRTRSTLHGTDLGEQR